MTMSTASALVPRAGGIGNHDVEGIDTDSLHEPQRISATCISNTSAKTKRRLLPSTGTARRQLLLFATSSQGRPCHCFRGVQRANRQTCRARRLASESSTHNRANAEAPGTGLLSEESMDPSRLSGVTVPSSTSDRRLQPAVHLGNASAPCLGIRVYLRAVCVCRHEADVSTW